MQDRPHSKPRGGFCLGFAGSINHGEWQELWNDAHIQPQPRPLKPRTQQETGYRKAARAEHFVLNGHFKEARQVLTSNGLAGSCPGTGPAHRSQLWHPGGRPRRPRTCPVPPIALASGGNLGSRPEIHFLCDCSTWRLELPACPTRGFG